MVRAECSNGRSTRFDANQLRLLGDHERSKRQLTESQGATVHRQQVLALLAELAHEEMQTRSLLRAQHHVQSWRMKDQRQEQKRKRQGHSLSVALLKSKTESPDGVRTQRFVLDNCSFAEARYTSSVRHFLSSFRRVWCSGCHPSFRLSAKSVKPPWVKNPGTTRLSSGTSIAAQRL